MDPSDVVHGLNIYPQLALARYLLSPWLLLPAMPSARKFPLPQKTRPAMGSQNHEPPSNFFEWAQDVTITGGQFTVVGPDDNITHYGQTTTFRFDEPAPEEQVPSVLNVNSGNVNKTCLENVANQNVHLHLHYTEIYSTPKDGGEPIRTERFNYDMVPKDSDADVQEYKHSVDGVFSRALDVADKSKKSRELKKTFKSLLGLLQDDLADDGNVSNSTITEEEDSSADSTEYFSACDTPLSLNPTPAAAHTSMLSDKLESHKDLQPLPWTETVHDFVNSVTAMSRRAAGVHESDICPDPSPARTAPAPSLPSSLLAAQAPLSHPGLVDLIQDAVRDAVQKQFAALQIDSAASSPNPIPALSQGNTAKSSINHRPSFSPIAPQKRPREVQCEPGALKGIWEGRIICDYREVKARLPGRHDPARPIIKERTVGRFMMPIGSRSPVSALEGDNALRPRRQIKRPRLSHQRSRDGYDADGDDSEGG